MRTDLLNKDVKKAIQIWSLNQQAINEMGQLNKMYLDTLEMFREYDVADADLAAFVTWNMNVANALSTGLIHTSAICIYTSIVVGRLNKKRTKAVQIANMSAANAGLTYEGIIKAVQGDSNNLNINRSGRSSDKSLNDYASRLRGSQTVSDAYRYGSTQPRMESACTSGGRSSSRC